MGRYKKNKWHNSKNNNNKQEVKKVLNNYINKLEKNTT